MAVCKCGWLAREQGEEAAAARAGSTAGALEQAAAGAETHKRHLQASSGCKVRSSEEGAEEGERREEEERKEERRKERKEKEEKKKTPNENTDS